MTRIARLPRLRNRLRRVGGTYFGIDSMMPGLYSSNGKALLRLLKLGRFVYAPHEEENYIMKKEIISMIKRYFRFDELQTDFRHEITGGLTTFKVGRASW